MSNLMRRSRDRVERGEVAASSSLSTVFAKESGRQEMGRGQDEVKSVFSVQSTKMLRHAPR